MNPVVIKELGLRGVYNGYSACGQAIHDVMDRLDGPRAEIQRVSSTTNKKQTKQDDKKHVVVVCFIGGVTQLERSALAWLAHFCTCGIVVVRTCVTRLMRWLAVIDPIELMIASTSVIHRNSFLHDVLERMPVAT